MRLGIIEEIDIAAPARPQTHHHLPAPIPVNIAYGRPGFAHGLVVLGPIDPQGGPVDQRVRKILKNLQVTATGLAQAQHDFLGAITREVTQSGTGLADRQGVVLPGQVARDFIPPGIDSRRQQGLVEALFHQEGAAPLLAQTNDDFIMTIAVDITDGRPGFAILLGVFGPIDMRPAHGHEGRGRETEDLHRALATPPKADENLGLAIAIDITHGGARFPVPAVVFGPGDLTPEQMGKIIIEYLELAARHTGFTDRREADDHFVLTIAIDIAGGQACLVSRGKIGFIAQEYSLIEFSLHTQHFELSARIRCRARAKDEFKGL